jgi:hypothetical protein
VAQLKESFNYAGKEGKVKIKQGAGLGVAGVGGSVEREFNANTNGGYSDLKDGGGVEGFFLKMSYSEKENKDGTTDQSLTFSLTGRADFIIGVEGSIDVNYTKKKEEE